MSDTGILQTFGSKCPISLSRSCLIIIISHDCGIPVSYMAHMVTDNSTKMWDTEILPPCQTLKSYHRVRHWNSTNMSDTGILQKCQTLKSYHHVRHWNSTNMSDTEILPPCQTLKFHKHVRHWNPTTSHMAVKFQCLAWRWNSGVSNSCGIPVSHMAVEFQCLTWW
jgi:hypothetical protein